MFLRIYTADELCVQMLKNNIEIDITEIAIIHNSAIHNLQSKNTCNCNIQIAVAFITINISNTHSYVNIHLRETHMKLLNSRI
jgi:hypothetical protein